MDVIRIKQYFDDLKTLTTNDFEKQLLEATLNNLLAKGNKLRFNNFSYGIRELTRHILGSLAPEEEIEKCCWYPIDSKQKGKFTRAERIKYIIQKGLPDEFVEGFYDVEEHIDSIKSTMEILNKYTHVNKDTFNIDEVEIDSITEEVLDAFSKIVAGLSTYHNLLKIELHDHIDKELLDHSISTSIDEVDMLSTHHNIEESETSSIKINDVSSTAISVRAFGSISVRQQYGSDSDFRKGDGLEIHSSFPFDCDLTIEIAKDFNKSRYIIDRFDVDTDSFYEWSID